ncbi:MULTISPECIES: glucosaminidase domain-containing protein [unclassified Shewanella]|uniref:glucosaminidase domain-containing protein n=1 Tax=unclassified Shewanella TaxID=196818 RepID=UPI001BBFA657|nr:MULTISPECIES: glucosaminidase domain-containing protein [unclassified Shewanella]GIU21446.1 glucosaminidase [Shewanella sp. MBTL60-112-B1]GIU33471.1 glucosaminidase [Shewanella sp. MBTL60-112-B2]
MLKKPQTLIALAFIAIALILYAANSQFNPESSLLVTVHEPVQTSVQETVKPAPKTVAADLATPSDSDGTQTSFIKVSEKRPTKAPKDIRINSLDELMTLFNSLNYNTKSWQDGNREVPRLTFESVSERWQETSNQIPVQQKKMVFFRLLAPLILVANENILLERRLIESAPLDDVVLQRIAKKYKITKDADTPLTEQQRQTLLEEVDIMPPSLVLAQAAEESGWATSRFTVEGNAFFGQWDFSGKGMIPKQQRKELGNYGLARFDTPLASVEGYMLNLNTNNAYKKLRELRAKLRAENKPITGMELAGTLDKYSERGQAYIDGIRQMISYNKLDQVDEAYLSDAAPLHLIPRPD